MLRRLSPRGLLDFARVVLRRTVRGFVDARGYDLGASLAYTSLLTFVPLIAAVTVLTSTLFGDSGTGLYRLIRALVPAATPELIKDLQLLTAQARALSGWATFLFLVTSLRMFFLVEGAADALWGTEIRRRPLIRLGVGLVLVVFGPIAVGILTSLLLEAGASFTQFRPTGLILNAALLTLFYWSIPSAKVRWGAAAAAGLVAGLGVTLLKLALTRGVAALTSYSRVYGSISAVVIFILALGFVWDILLLGVSLAHALQFREELLAHDEPEREARRSGPLDEAVRMLLRLVSAWDKDAKPVPLAVLSDDIRRPEGDTRSRLKKLVSAGLIADAGGGYALSRAPETISIYSVARAIGESLPRPVPFGDDVTAKTLRRVFRRADREVRGVLQGTSLRDLAISHVFSTDDRARSGVRPRLEPPPAG